MSVLYQLWSLFIIEVYLFASLMRITVTELAVQACYSRKKGS